MNTSFLTPSQLTVLIGLLSIAAELFIGVNTGFDLVIIGGILVVAGFLGILSGSTQVVFILTVILTLLYFIFARKTIKRKLTSQHAKTNVDKLVGDKGVALTAIAPHQPGRVRVDGEDWRAISQQSIQVGNEIMVESVTGVTVSVKKLS